MKAAGISSRIDRLESCVDPAVAPECRSCLRLGFFLAEAIGVGSPEGVQMLHEFLEENKTEILALTEEKTLELAGIRPSSKQLKQGLPIFYRQLVDVLRLQEKGSTFTGAKDVAGMALAATDSDEQGIARASGRPEEADLAKEAGIHGSELMRLGYTLSHVVHAYGAMCQSITELASKKKAFITPEEFHDLNRCLDVAIAGAVTEFQSHTNTEDIQEETEHLGFLAHELRNALASANISLQLIKRGTVGFSGNTGRVLDKSMKRLEALIDRSLTEVRLRVDQKLHVEPAQLLQLVDQIAITARTEAEGRGQVLEVSVDPMIVIEADQQLFFSALSNLIQNALKYTKDGGRIQVRGKVAGEEIVVEVEDECGGLPDGVATDLFQAFEQKHENRTGLGLGLTIAQRAIQLNNGTIEIKNLPGTGCIFRITLPRKAASKGSSATSAA